jgi:lipopolysaccharide assembly protein A
LLVKGLHLGIRVDGSATGYVPDMAQSAEHASASPSPTVKAKRRRTHKPTRTSWAWGTLILGVLLGIALVDFLAQNTRSVRIEFFSASGQIPIAVALLVAALAGGAIVLVVGAARIGQLRHRLRNPSTPPAEDAASPATASKTPPSDKAA